MVIKFYNIDSTFTPGEWYIFFYKEKKKNSKKTRLLSDCFQHFVLNYPFLDETQQWGKVYQSLGIPQICGKIDKAKLKKLFAVEKKEKARLNKLKLKITQIKIRDNNQTDKKDSKLVKKDKQNAKKQQNQIQETATAEILVKPNSFTVGNHRQLALKKKNINEEQINQDVGSVLDYVRKSEIQLKKRVRFKNVQVLCYDKSNSTESEMSTSSLIINTPEEVVNNNHEKAVHKPYFERLNDSLSSESNTEIEGNHAHLKIAPPIRLIEKEIDLALNKEKSLPENNKEMSTRDNHSKEGDIRNLLDILGREQDNRVLSLCDQMYSKDYDNDSSSDNEVRIIPPFPTGYEDDNTQSSDSLINDHDTGVMSPSYPSDDESNHDIVIIRERDGIKDDKLNNTNIKANTSWEIRNSSGEELSEAGIKKTIESGNEPNAAHDEHQMQVESLVCSNLVQNEHDKSANTHLSVHSASGDRTSIMDYQFTDEIDIAEKNNADNEFSPLKPQNYDQVKQQENNNNSGGIFEPNAARDERQTEFLVCSNLVQSEHDTSANRHLSELQCDAISPLSSDSSDVGHLMHLTPSGKLLTAIGNIEKFRLSSSASFSLESSDIQQEFGFSTGTIYKSFVLDKDNKKEQTFSSDSFNQNNTKEEARTKENNLISLSNQERINSSDKMDRLNTKEELLNEHVKINMVEIEKENCISKKGYPTIIPNSDATTTGSSENTVPSSIIAESKGKREPLKLISNVRPKGNYSRGRNIARNGNNSTDKENIVPEISNQTSPKKSISRETPKKDYFFSESSSCEVDKIVELMDLSSHDENRLRLSNTSIIRTHNNRGEKVSESDAGEKNSSLISELGTHKKYNKLKKSTDENPITDKSQITLSRKANSHRETGGNDFAVQEIHFSTSSDVLSETPDVLNNNEEYKSRENSNEAPKVFVSRLENMMNKNICLENISKDRNSELKARKNFSFKSPSTTINSSDSWSGKEYLLKNFNERVSKIRKQDAPNKALDDVCKTYFNANKNFTKSKSRESTVRKVTSILNNSSQSSPELLDLDDEMDESNEYQSISDLSTQSVITDLGVKAYFNDPAIIPFDSSSDNSINLIPDYNSRSSTAAQRIKNLNLISPQASNNTHLNYDGGPSVKSLGPNEDAEMQEIDVYTRESITNMNISYLPEEEMETVKPLNQNKRKASSSSIRMTTGLNNDHDADSSSDGCIVLSHKKIKRRRKKASRVAAKLKNHRRRGVNEDQLTSSDEFEIINEILMDQKKEKRKLTGKKSTTTNTILINAINDLRNEKTTNNYQHSQKLKLSDDDNNQSSLNECDSSKEAIDSIGGQRITNETLKLRKTSIVKQKINSSDTSTTSEFINSALARRIYYL